MAQNSGTPGVPSTATTAVSGAVTPAAWWASTRQHLTRAAADLQTASRNWKAPDFSKGLGVKLDIDMLSPAVTTVKQQYAALPETLREVMPFAGVAAVTSIFTSKVYDHHLHQAQQRYMALRRDHEQLQEQLAQVDAKWGDVDLRKTNTHLQVQMAEAVAKATTAAAAAATAAASAAAAAAAAAPTQKDGSRWP